ncbi:MAG: prepilin-type N-terminal cleavage/methylation domain-containing protein [Acidobacteriaceae bacterium]|jgi:prepilin-type N-terminal cleavage/methylation domain-containing protein
MASTKQRGFSLLELMITISISLIIGGITFMAMQPLLLQNHVNSAYERTLMVMRNTRNQAITQGHQYYVTFFPQVGNPAAGGTAAYIQVQYQPPVVGGIAQPLQQVQNYSLPLDVNFALMTGAIPPDGLPVGLNAIDFESQPGIPLNYIVFMPDGSAQDSVGNLSSGIVYIARPAGNQYTSKAVSVMGSTGRIRGWFLDQLAGNPIWEQQ